MDYLRMRSALQNCCALAACSTLRLFCMRAIFGSLAGLAGLARDAQRSTRLLQLRLAAAMAHASSEPSLAPHWQAPPKTSTSHTQPHAQRTLQS